MLITVVLQNLGHGGRNRWSLLRQRLRQADADVLMLNETNGFDGNGHAMLSRVADDLELEALPLTFSSSGYRPMLMFRRSRLGMWQHCNNDFSAEITHGAQVAAWPVPGLPGTGDSAGGLLTFGVTHITPISSVKAEIEAETIASRGYRYGPWAVLGMDANHPPLDGPPADVSQMRPYNIARRFADPRSNPPSIPNTKVAERLADNGYVDAAAHLYRHGPDGMRGNEALRQRTGTSDRIDWIMVSKAVAPALVWCEHLREPAEASDHHGVRVVLDTDKIKTADAWSYR